MQGLSEGRWETTEGLKQGRRGPLRAPEGSFTLPS